MTDPITDMLNRIRNAQAVLKKTVSLPYSNIKYEIAKILEQEKFVDKAEKRGRNPKKYIDINLKYNEKVGAINGLKRISKPGRRVYTGSRNIKGSKGLYGILIISTPKGLMTDKKARKQKLGGEVICEIW